MSTVQHRQAKKKRLFDLATVLFQCFLAGQLVVSRAADAPESSSECSKCSIYILDLSSFAHTHGFPVCDLNKVVVDPTTGVVYLKEKDTGIQKKVSHKYGTHSAPWFLEQAIRHSDCYVDDISKANVVFVYDYCYYIWWLAHIHSALGKAVHETPGDYLIKGWTALIQLPRWQHSSGRDFVFYDSHPGFAQGNSAPTFVGMFCNEFRHATHIVVESAQRNVCQSFLEIQKMLITPYVPNVVDAEKPLAVLEQPSVPKADRNITVYFRGRCTPVGDLYIGKKMRHVLVKALADKGSDLDVACSEADLGGSQEKYSLAFHKMEHSIFCLVLPGDAQSTRRLTEIFLAGCIPVFLGPPYSTMPLAEDVEYSSIGVFFNITEYSGWLEKKMEWEVHPTERAQHGQEAQWWIPDADLKDVMISEKAFENILGHLREMPESEIARKLSEMNEVRHKFSFQESMASPPNALNVIIKRVCQKFRHHQVPNQRHRSKLLGPSEEAASPEDDSGPSSLLGKAWLQIFSKSANTSAERLEGAAAAGGSMAGAIRTRGSSWHPFSFKGGLLDVGKEEDFQASSEIPDVDLD